MYTPDPKQDAAVNVWAATDHLTQRLALLLVPREHHGAWAQPAAIAERFNLSHAKAAELIDGIAQGGAPRAGWSDTDDVDAQHRLPSWTQTAEDLIESLGEGRDAEAAPPIIDPSEGVR